MIRKITFEKATIELTATDPSLHDVHHFGWKSRISKSSQPFSCDGV